MNDSNGSMKPVAFDTTRIPGWGVDADPANNPTYPYRDRTKDDHSGTWTRPTQQESEVEILQSIEHKATPAVFGTSTPPSGISGALRRAAFRKSESNLLHWLGLMGADRINMIEGVMQDFKRGHVPNVPGEMGIRSEWQYNKSGLVLKVVAVAGVVALAVTLLRSRRAIDSD